MKLSAILPLAVGLLGIASHPSIASPMEYQGLCEASAAGQVGPEHFAVAGDESNILRIYRFGEPDVKWEKDFEDFTGFDKSDIEGAATIGNRIYWISSHSYSKAKPGEPAEDKKKRKVLFATDIVLSGQAPTLTGVQAPQKKLRDAIAKALDVEHETLNIEGLTATPEGSLLIALRAPLMDKKAWILELKNPAEVVEHSAAPDFGKPVPLDLGDKGIRSIDLVGDGEHRYLISAGPVDDGGTFSLFWWAGPPTTTATPQTYDFEGIADFKPEAFVAMPGTSTIAIFSDDGDRPINGKKCKDEDDKMPVEERRFRGVVFDPTK